MSINTTLTTVLRWAVLERNTHVTEPALIKVRKRDFLRHLYIKMIIFTKTSSGHTWENSKKDAFLQALVRFLDLADDTPEDRGVYGNQCFPPLFSSPLLSQSSSSCLSRACLGISSCFRLNMKRNNN
jgi:hypothetical protein